ncbi:MAG: tRNA (adenosine(37)-N6)-threonylcarbamoyltransferase complex dimerization subunit type 1 TsaB, partial [Magnetococcus sp. DMHC-8]
AGHAVLLPERVAALLARESCSCAELELIAVTIGPGSFAGLRIALGYAQGIALVQGTPVVGVSGLDVLAAGAGCTQGWLSVVVDARRGELFAALYHLDGGVPRRYLAPTTAQTPTQWADTLAGLSEWHSESLCLTGSGLHLHAGIFRTVLGRPFAVTPESTWVTDPFLLGLLGQQLFGQARSMQAGDTPLLATLPDYQRSPDAEVKIHGAACRSGQ